MATYNVTFLDNATTYLDVAAGVNTASDGWLFGGILIITWLLLLFAFHKFEFADNLIGSSSIVTVLAIILFFSDLLSGWVITLPVLMSIVGVFVKITS